MDQNKITFSSFDKNKTALAALSMDLKRVAIGINRGSFEMAKIFKDEASRRLEEIDTNSVQPYLQKIIKKARKELLLPDTSKTAEDYLMYSVLVQNYVLLK